MKAATAPGKVAGAQSIRRAVKVLRILAVGQERGHGSDVVEIGAQPLTAHRILASSPRKARPSRTSRHT
jgi:hypothetical protein